MQDPKLRRAREVALAGTPHPLLPPRAHILMDAITLPSVLSTHSFPTAARTSCLFLYGRDCRHQWPGPLLARLFPGDGAAYRRCSDHDGGVAGVQVRDGRWCPCMTPTELRAAQGLRRSPRAQASKGSIGKNPGWKRPSAERREEKERDRDPGLAAGVDIGGSCDVPTTTLGESTSRRPDEAQGREHD